MESYGHIFRTRTDTEVILKAYAHWGTKCVHHLRGIFAFAIWQTEKQQSDHPVTKLFLARDQLGVKPLYYWKNDHTLLFASEVRALLASGLVARKLDQAGLRSYLAYGSVQDPFTLVEGVESLLPGHTLTWKDGRTSVERYWQLPDPKQASTNGSSDTYEQVRERLDEAIRLQMVADVPLGAFLSGGIDSTVIAALAQKAIDRPLKTFSVVFDEAAYDERHYSQIAARHIGTDHTELHLTGESVVKTLPQALMAFDQPSMDGLNTYFVSKVTREAGLTVALSGVGGDELFGGYNGYHKTVLAERWGKRIGFLPQPMRFLVSNAIRSVATRESHRKAAALWRDPKNSYFLTREIYTPAQIADLLKPDFNISFSNQAPPTFDRILTETAEYDPINRASALELQTYMLSTLLRDTDQMSMAHALEVRVPLLDHKLVEYIFSLPGDRKLNSHQPKPLLTYSMNGDIPSECVHRPKRGFELPFAIWLKASLQSQVRGEFFNESVDRDIPFSVNGMKNIWSQFEQGRLGWSRVWGVYVLLHWLSSHRVAA